MATSSVPAAALRRLTGVTRGGALAIARHSLRGVSSARAGTIIDASTARTAATERNMAGPFVCDDGASVSPIPDRHYHDPINPPWAVARARLTGSCSHEA